MFIDPLIVYTIYERPADYPASYVIRRWSVLNGEATSDPEPMAVVPTLSAARAAIPEYLVQLLRSPDDDPTIVETWL